MACNSEKTWIVNIPSVTFRSFIQVADRNTVNGNQLQTLCYLLGPPQKTSKDDVWIDTLVIPKQMCSISTVEDYGIEDKDSINYLKEMSFTKKKEIFAWVHTRSPCEKRCEFSSIDMHTQYVLEKYVSKNIVGIIIELRKDDFVWNAMHLNIFGKQRVEFCAKNYNTPFNSHKWCDCECLYESCRSSIKLWEDIPFGKSKVLMANFMKDKKPGEGWWGLAEEPSDTGKLFF